MDSAPQFLIDDPTAPSSARWQNFESAVGPLIQAFIAAGIIIGSILFLVESSTGPMWIIADAIVVFIWCVTTEGWLLYSTWHVISKGISPYPIAIALRTPKLPLFVRPFVAIWWGYQSLLALCWAIGAVIASRQMSFLATCVLTLLTYAFAHATFGFALLAVSVFTKGSALQKLWTWHDRWALIHALTVIVAHVLVSVLG